MNGVAHNMVRSYCTATVTECPMNISKQDSQDVSLPILLQNQNHQSMHAREQSEDHIPTLHSKKPKSKRSHKSASMKRSYSGQPSKKQAQLPLSINVGDHVLLTVDREGIVLYIGEVHFARGIWFGIELMNGSVGTHDGIIGNKRYFHTSPGRGLFVQGSKIRRKMRERDWASSPRQRRRHSLQQMLRIEQMDDDLDMMDLNTNSIPNKLNKSKSQQFETRNNRNNCQLAIATPISIDDLSRSHSNPSTINIDTLKNVLRAEIEMEFQTKFDELKKLLMEKQKRDGEEENIDESPRKKRKHKSKKKKKKKKKKKSKRKRKLNKKRKSKSISNANPTARTHGRTISLVSESLSGDECAPPTPTSVQMTEASDFDDTDIRYHPHQQISKQTHFWSLRK
eukprot:1156157_1